MENLNILGRGVINGGTYDKIKINGSAKVSSNVVAKSISVNGSANFQDSIFCESLKCNGAVNCEKDFKGVSTDVSGSLNINSDIICDDVSVTGALNVLGYHKGKKLHVNGSAKFYADSTCEDFKVIGYALVKGEICAENVTIKTRKTDIEQIHAENVEIKKSLSVTSYILKPAIKVNEIECTNLTADHLICKKLCATNVKIAKNCVIDYLEYSGEIEMDNTCKINELVKL